MSAADILPMPPNATAQQRRAIRKARRELDVLLEKIRISHERMIGTWFNESAAAVQKRHYPRGRVRVPTFKAPS